MKFEYCQFNSYTNLDYCQPVSRLVRHMKTTPTFHSSEHRATSSEISIVPRHGGKIAVKQFICTYNGENKIYREAKAR